MSQPLPQTSAAPPIAFVGFGEAALAFVLGWRGALGGINLSAFDIKTDSPNAQVRDAKLKDYNTAEVVGEASLENALTGRSVIFSVVTADQALDAAKAAAQYIETDALYFDCNSCAPDTKREAAKLINAAGGRYVDVAVMAPVHPALHHVPLLIGGPYAGDAKTVFDGLDMKAEIASDQIGIASSIKMVRSVMIKGLEALVVECVLSGRKAGVEEQVIASLDKSFPGFNWQDKAAYMLERVATHGIRRAAEMREVALTVEQLGLHGDMAKAIVEWQQRIGDLALRLQTEGYQDRADEILKGLDR